ncbi:creatininase family protein [Candidatus Bathyarchaeota archaeon]|nr:creatininase family protein [Candidatus Bathyarchaeota archaeon]
MTWKDIQARLMETKTIIIPFGSTEEHGHHLPLSTDTQIAYELAVRVAKKAGVLVAPPICYGVCRRTGSFPGTISLSFETLRLLVRDLVESLYSQGFRDIIFLPGHLGDAQLVGMELSAQEAVKNYGDLNLAIIRLPKILEKLPQGLVSEPLGHAGEVETSIMLAISPNQVSMEKATFERPNFPPHTIIRDSKIFMKSGVMGDATKATVEKGEAILELLVEEISKIIQQLYV